MSKWYIDKIKANAPELLDGNKYDVLDWIDNAFVMRAEDEDTAAAEVPLYDISHLSDGVREIPRGAVNTLAARMGTGGGNVAILNEADRQETDDVRTVRRLTVTECERLQGLPDGYTDVPINGKPASESERLKAIGNGMAQPCADFVIAGIVRVTEEKK